MCKAVLFSALIFLSHSLGACTGMGMTASDGTFVNGRTVEFGVKLDMSVAVIPRNFSFTGKTPSGPGKQYVSKYAAVGIYCFDEPVLMDGLNEKGLTCAAFYFPGFASYSKMTNENQKNALSPIEFPNWVLSQFATLEEVKRGIESVVIAPTVLKDWGSTPPPMHYVVYDKTGNSLVIEPLNETLVVYENPLGVITNSPDFNWQMTNLSNYVNLSPINVENLKLGKVQFNAFGQGSGMLGLPGDFTPPSRFVRAAFFSSTAKTTQSARQAVDQTFHILNQFDIPLGSVQGKENGTTSYDYTLLTSVKSSAKGEYFFRTYDNQAIEYVNLNEFDLDAKTIKKMKVSSRQTTKNVSSELANGKM